MNVKNLLGLACVFLLALPVMAEAEIYKWKDKNGVMRYSDTPPPVSIKADTLGKTSKAQKPQGSADVEKEKVQPEAGKEIIESSDASAEEESARMRALNEEADKKERMKLEKEQAAKVRKENCKAAKANYQTFSEGGRIYKTNANGEREYYGDVELKSEKLKAQREMKKFCK